MTWIEIGKLGVIVLLLALILWREWQHDQRLRQWWCLADSVSRPIVPVQSAIVAQITMDDIADGLQRGRRFTSEDVRQLWATAYYFQTRAHDDKKG